MLEDKILIAEYSIPFPAFNFESKLDENKIPFESLEKGVEGHNYRVYYISNKDIEKVIKIKKEVDAEDYESYVKHRFFGKKWLEQLIKILIFLSLGFYIYHELKRIFS